jgi:hypothetical protein
MSLLSILTGAQAFTPPTGIARAPHLCVKQIHSPAKVAYIERIRASDQGMTPNIAKGIKARQLIAEFIGKEESATIIQITKHLCSVSHQITQTSVSRHCASMTEKGILCRSENRKGPNCGAVYWISEGEGN